MSPGTVGPRRPRAVALALLLAAAPAGAAAGGDLDGHLRVPPPRLWAGVDTAVRERLEASYRRVVDAATSAEGDPAAPGLGNAYGELGRAALAYRLHEIAEPALRAAVELLPDEHRWLYYLGALLHGERRLGQAAAALAGALALKPQDLPTRLRLAQVLHLQGEAPAATEHYEAARRVAPDTAAALYGLGRLAAERQDWAAAKALLERALALQPEADEVRHQLGLAHRATGDLEQARRLLGSPTGRRLRFPDPLMQSLRDEFPRGHMRAGLEALQAGDAAAAVAALRRAVADDPDNAAVRRALGSALLAAGDLTAARREYEEAVRLEPQEAKGHLGLGLVWARDPDSLPAALASLERAVELAPDLPDGRLALAERLAAAGRLAEAVSHLEAALALGSDAGVRTRLARARLQLGRMAERRGRPAEAADHYARALEIDPGDDAARLRRAEALLQAGKGKEARTELERLAAGDPAAPPTALARAELAAGRGDLAAALQALEAALAAAPPAADQARLLFRAGALHQGSGRGEAAIPFYRRALEADPDFKDAHFNLALALGAAADFDGAALHLERAVAIDPADRQARHALVGALLRARRFADAHDALEAARGHDPDDPGFVATLARLLALCPDGSLRAPGRAVELAREARARWPGVASGETLALALAAAGGFDEARAIQQEALARAEAEGLPAPVRERLRADLERYRAGEAPPPWP